MFNNKTFIYLFVGFLMAQQSVGTNYIHASMDNLERSGQALVSQMAQCSLWTKFCRFLVDKAVDMASCGSCANCEPNHDDPSWYPCLTKGLYHPTIYQPLEAKQLARLSTEQRFVFVHLNLMQLNAIFISIPSSYVRSKALGKAGQNYDSMSSTPARHFPPSNAVHLKEFFCTKKILYSSSINGALVCTHKNNTDYKIYIKKLHKNGPVDNSLVVSYITSRLLQRICPGQSPLIVPVLSSGDPLVGSLHMDGFISINEESGLVDYETYKKDPKTIQLTLALQLVGISDLHTQNVGFIKENNHIKAAVVDFDTRHPDRIWLWDAIKENGYAGSFDLVIFKKALAEVLALSEQDIAFTIEVALAELESVYLIKNPKRYFNVEEIAGHITDTRAQMSWAYANIGALYDIWMQQDKDPLWAKRTTISDDRYGYFLTWAIKNQDQRVIDKLIAYGSRDPFGKALEAAVLAKNLILLKKIIPLSKTISRARALYLAIREDRLNMVQVLLESGAWPEGLDHPLLVAVFNNNPSMVSLLLRYGIGDFEGAALQEARRSGRPQLISLLETQHI